MGVFIDTGWNATIADDAGFRDRVQRIRNAIAAAGGTRVTGLPVTPGGALPDDLTAGGILKPTAVNGNSGWDIYRFNDDLHNTDGKQCFIRIWYGTGTSGALVLGLWAQVMTKIDANGNLAPGGIQGRQVRLAYTTVPNNSGFYVSADDDRLTFMAGILQNSNAWGYHVERVLEGDGTPNEDYLLEHCGSWGGDGGGQVIPYANPVAPAFNTSDPWILLVGSTGGSTTAHGERCVSPYFVPIGRWAFGRLLRGRSADFPVGAQYAFDYLGQSRNFFACGHFAGSSSGILIPWE